MFSRQIEWDAFERAKFKAMVWAKENYVDIFKYHFIDQVNSPSEVYIFYKSNQDIYNYAKSGATEVIKEIFYSSFCDCKKEGISIIVDSDENVKKNYDGNYFFRYR